MPAEVAIIHGWSDTSKSFHDLRDFLSRNGYAVRQIWLGDYVSMDDDVRVPDVAKRMQSVIGELIAQGDLTVPFDLIVHSTGGLVAREWVATFYPDGAGCPAKRIIMLAPANFGSRLAALGKSMIGRIAKGWNNWFQTGQEMLRGLELASPYQWRLATRDLVDPGGAGGPGPYGEGKIWPFVIAGTAGYSGGLREIVNEPGSDGTVRPAAANLNAVGMTIDFSTDARVPAISQWGSRVAARRLPMAVLPDRDHGSIVRPDHSSSAEPEVQRRLGRLILQALACDSDGRYGEIAEEWYRLSEDTHERRKLLPEGSGERGDLHQYMQFVVRARDDHGQPVDDYFLEFFSPRMKGDKDVLYFHKNVLEHVHTNSVSPSLRCLFVDRTDLVENFYRLARTPDRQTLALSVSAAQLGRNVRYFDKTHEGARGQVVIHALEAAARDDLEARVRRNSTHLIDMILPRQPVDKVFKLAR
jgi:hypothetical protein